VVTLIIIVEAIAYLFLIAWLVREAKKSGEASKLLVPAILALIASLPAVLTLADSEARMTSNRLDIATKNDPGFVGDLRQVGPSVHFTLQWDPKVTKCVIDLHPEFRTARYRARDQALYQYAIQHTCDSSIKREWVLNDVAAEFLENPKIRDRISQASTPFELTGVEAEIAYILTNKQENERLYTWEVAE